MYRQAYLIIAHQCDETFKTLLQMLDCVENDIFVHMDRKNKKFDENDCRKVVKKAGLFFTERTSVAWGGYSLINAEIILLEAATLHGKYNYYHLISGQDLPIKTNDYIKKFFMKHQGKEFVAFDKEDLDYQDRVQYFYPLQEIVGRNRKSVLGRVAALMTVVQKCLRVQRNKNVKFRKGPEWFSITDDFAHYIVQNKAWIRKVFHDTIACDEVFLQTMIVNSPFIEQVYQYETIQNTEEAAMRLVDWSRGGPYVVRNEDYQEIMNSEMLFARKFDCGKDADIVKKIFNRGK